MSVVSQIETCYQRVEKILEANPRTQDCDWTLYITYLKTYHEVVDSMPLRMVTIKVLNDKDIPSYEGVTRARRKIQEGGKFLGTKRKERLAEAPAVSEWAVNN
jgi:hypothetical protein